MSYILDALKKLENEKQKKSRSDGMVSISGELFKDEPRRTSGRNAWKIALLVVAASLVTFGATWFLMEPGKGRDKNKPRTVIPATSITRVSPQVTPSPSPVQQPPAATPQASAVAPAVLVPKPPAAVSAASDVKKVAPAGITRQREKRHKVPEEKAARPAAVEKSAPVYGEAPADIKVSGIAWQDERRARWAVVNGFLFREGGVVSGARITEILKDRVRFSSAGKVFEVHLTVSGLAGAEK